MPDCSGAGSTGSCVLPDVGAGNPTQALTGRVQAISQAPSILLVEKKECQALARDSSSKPAMAAGGVRSQPGLPSPVTHPPPHMHKKRRTQHSEVGVSQAEATDRVFWISALQTGGLWKAIDGGVWDPGPPDWGRAASSFREHKAPQLACSRRSSSAHSLSSLILTSSQACGPTSGQLELDAAWDSRLQFRLFLSLIPKFLHLQPIIYLLIATVLSIYL